MKRLLVVGCFGDKTGRLDGQIVKTRDIYEMLSSRKSKDVRLDMFNTLSVRDNPILLLSLFVKLLRCNTAILIPADRNLTKFFPFLYILSKLARYEIIQLCVGGWQVDYFIGRGKWAAHPLQKKQSMKCKAFLPEIEKVNRELKSLCHFTNCEVFPNFRRNFPVISHVNSSKELRLVWLSRINKEKGYDTVFNLADRIEKEGLKITITFYGKVEEASEKEFNGLVERHQGVVKYEGQLPSEKIAKTLCDYDVMVLPTKYYTEGFPGTVLDAYISGLPVVATEWMHAREFIEEGVSGFVVPFENPQQEFDKRILEMCNDRALLSRLKQNAREKTKFYTEDRAWNVIKKYL